MSASKHTILIVEDELPFRLIYRDALEISGYHVVEAENGDEAMEAIERSLPDLILLDLVLPKLSGFDVLASLKRLSKTKDVPVIIYSVLDDKISIDRALALGASDFAIKGETPTAKVVEKVHKLLGNA